MTKERRKSLKAAPQYILDSLKTPSEKAPCKTCGGTTRVLKVYGKEYDCELSTSYPCPDCQPAKERV